jgi:L-lysine 2,3-aminomutase
VAASAWLNRPLPFRPTGEGQGLLLAASLPPRSPNAESPPSEITPAAGALPPWGSHPWRLRAAHLFDPHAPDLIPDYFAQAQPFVELRLCAGAAVEADWDGLADLASRLRGISKEGVLRLELWYGDGTPVDSSLQILERLRSLRPLFVHAWVQRETELTPAVRAAWARLLDGGVPMAAEILLRRGGADSVEALRSLCRKLLEWRVRPYLLIDGAWLPEAERVRESEAMELLRGLRGWISGLAVPQLAQESTGGVRSIRIPAYVVRLDEAGAELVSYRGQRHRYPRPPDE